MSEEWIIRFEQWLEDNEYEMFYGFEILEEFLKFKKEAKES